MRERRALNSWLFHLAGRRRLRGLVLSWRSSEARRGFNKWRDATRRRPRAALGSPINLRAIRAMTWRESVAWLHHIGIPVSRSPPTLLRTLRAGSVYSEVVRKVSLTFWVRHKMPQIANALTLFATLQHFFETDLVTRVVGCQRLDVRALEQGKAIEHLELLSSLREVYEETQLSPVDVIASVSLQPGLYIAETSRRLITSMMGVTIARNS